MRNPYDVDRIREALGVTQHDFVVENHGSIFLLRPRTEAAREWINEHLPEDATTFAEAVVVEHRYIVSIIDGLKDDGLTIAPTE